MFRQSETERRAFARRYNCTTLVRSFTKSLMLYIIRHSQVGSPRLRGKDNLRGPRPALPRSRLKSRWGRAKFFGKISRPPAAASPDGESGSAVRVAGRLARRATLVRIAPSEIVRIAPAPPTASRLPPSPPFLFPCRRHWVEGAHRRLLRRRRPILGGALLAPMDEGQKWTDGTPQRETFGTTRSDYEKMHARRIPPPLAFALASAIKQPRQREEPPPQPATRSICGEEHTHEKSPASAGPTMNAHVVFPSASAPSSPGGLPRRSRSRRRFPLP